MRTIAEAVKEIEYAIEYVGYVEAAVDESMGPPYDPATGCLDTAMANLTRISLALQRARGILHENVGPPPTS